MNTENVVKHLRALWRTDRIIADIRLRHLLVGQEYAEDGQGARRRRIVRSALVAGAPQSFSRTSQMSGSVGSGLISKPSCRHISSITTFSLSTSPEMVLSPSDLA